MRILVISDSHGNISNLKHALGFAKKIEAGAIIHCGDWNNPISVRTILSLGVPLFSILGNADIDPKVEIILNSKSKKFDQKALEVLIDGRKILVIHNLKLLSLAKVKSAKDLDIIFFGHWQVQKETSWAGIKAVNPGALENGINFAIYDTKTNRVEFITEGKY